jgi:hypothetical protein
LPISINTFEAFDPLTAKSVANTEVAILAQKREISNILGSYVGWFDPFCELIQNSLDSVELRMGKEAASWIPNIWITIDLHENSLIVTDNGVGLNEDQFKQFLCPDISFKSGNTRGHKGVGATYLAYGFNYIQVATKSPNYTTVGRMEDARNWLREPNPSGNPKVKSDPDGPKDSTFDLVDRGVSIYLKFDRTTNPKDLKWLVSSTAEDWMKILSVKTAIGAARENKKIALHVKVVDKEGNTTETQKLGTSYLWPHTLVSKTASVKQIRAKSDEVYQRNGIRSILPSSFKNLDAIYETWTSDEILQLVASKQLVLTEEEIDIVNTYTPIVYVAYVYSLKIWDAINASMNLRSKYTLLHGGIQIAADNMPQGETIQIPLKRNIGRQNQIHVLIHFDNCSADLGRKGFQGEIVDFSKEISKKIADGPLSKVATSLKPNTGSTPNLTRESKVDDWKNEMIEHENCNPLILSNEHFFLPTKKVSISSFPTREQDVIALFNQLLAGGVIRGIRIMSTNERLTYDGLIRISINPPEDQHIYNETSNPLGVLPDVLQELKLPFLSSPKILEYKFSLDGLIEDIENGNKNMLIGNFASSF